MPSIPILLFLFFSIGFNMLMFIPAYWFETDKLTDISYALTFLALTWYGLCQSVQSPTMMLITAAISVWAVRLGSYLLVRIHKMGRDKRFDGMRENGWRFMKFWLLQGFTVWIVSLPAVLAFSIKNPVDNVTVSSIGVSVFLLGLIIETIADYQKYKFITNPKNQGKWIQSGLWKWSRHPNYFGEMIVWIGIWIISISTSVLPLWMAIVAAIGPLFIIIMLRFVSGVPLLEKSADQRWGNNHHYQTYKQSTSLIILLPKKS